MKNEEMMTLTLTRNQVIDIRLALASVMFSFQDEARDESLDPERRKIARDSAWKWRRLRSEIIHQFQQQDKP